MVKIQSGQIAPKSSLDRSSRHPNSNGANGTQTRARMEEIEPVKVAVKVAQWEFTVNWHGNLTPENG